MNSSTSAAGHGFPPQAGEDLRRSRHQMLEMAEAIAQIVWIAEADGARLHTNQRWVHYTGVGVEQSSGEGWLPQFHPDDQPLLREAWARALAGEADFNVECRLRGRDGNYRWMLNRGQPVRDDNGRIERWIGTCTDIDDLKRAQEAAHASEQALGHLALKLEAERARLVAAQGVAKVGSWETGSREFDWSAETHRIFGTVPGEFVPTQTGFLGFVHPDDRAAAEAAFQSAFQSRQPMVLRLRILAADGTPKQVELRWQVVGGPGETPRALGTSSSAPSASASSA